MSRDRSGDVSEHYHVLGIRECTRCGDTGNEGEEYAVDGIARIRGNLCVGCVRELDERLSEKRPVTDGGRDQCTEGLTRRCPLCPWPIPINALPTHLLRSHEAHEVVPP